MLKTGIKTEIWWNFLWEMTKKDIRLKYKFATLGFLWMVLNPILQMILVGMVFLNFVPVKTDNYFIYVLTGILPWNYFSFTVSRSVPIVINERNLINKAMFPREVLVLSVALSNLIHLGVSAGIIIPVLFILGKFSWHLLTIPAAIAGLFLISSSISFVLAALNVKYRDVNFLVSALLPMGFYVTPVVYSLDLIPAVWRNWFYLNPLTIIVDIFRFSFLGVGQINWMAVVIFLAGSLLAFVGSYLFFIKLSQNFEDYV